MGFPAINAHVTSQTLWPHDCNAQTSQLYLLTGAVYPLFSTPAIVDVSGMEFALGLLQDATATADPTVVLQSIASGASTVEILFGDGGTTATTDPGANYLTNADDFSNTVAGGYTAHGARVAAGTSTTDLDADDWVSLEAVANITGAAGIGAVVAKTAFIYGKPAAIN
jgi:hypothetical protein